MNVVVLEGVEKTYRLDAVAVAALKRVDLQIRGGSSPSPVPLIIRVWGEHELIALTTVGLIVVAVLSAWLPARRASHMNVVDALRHA